MSFWRMWLVAYTDITLILSIHRLLIFKFYSFHKTFKGSHADDNIYIMFIALNSTVTDVVSHVAVLTPTTGMKPKMFDRKAALN
jgi:hypothetical protein